MTLNIFLFLSLISWLCYITELHTSSIIIIWQLYFLTKYLKNHYDELDELENLELLENNYSNNNDDDDEDNLNDKKNILYEEKYLAELRKLKNFWEFNEEELNKETKLIQTLLINKKEELLNRLNILQNTMENYIKQNNKENDDYDNINNEYDVINDNNNKLNNDDNNDDNNEYNNDYNDDDDDDDNDDNNDDNNDEYIKSIEYNEKFQEINKEINLINIELNNEDKLLEDAKIIANKEIINDKIKRLENCYVMEKTPLGNVLMMYDLKNNVFKYYSDNNIPYRYLEVVARKYVKFYDCIPLYIDMNEELKIANEKYEKFKKEYEEKIEKQKQEKIINNEKDNKKEVFAKFKNYNKSSSINSNIISNKELSRENQNTQLKYINQTNQNSQISQSENIKVGINSIKERANRYTYEGKFANFSFLKKIDKKIFNKRLGLSFNDFKRNRHIF